MLFTLHQSASADFSLKAGVGKPGSRQRKGWSVCSEKISAAGEDDPSVISRLLPEPLSNRQSRVPRILASRRP